MLVDLQQKVGVMHVARIMHLNRINQRKIWAERRDAAWTGHGLKPLPRCDYGMQVWSRLKKSLAKSYCRFSEGSHACVCMRMPLMLMLHIEKNRTCKQFP